MKKWLMVHKEESYKTNSRALGFESNIHHVHEVGIGDEVTYYQNGGYIIGLFRIIKIATLPNKIEQSWSSEILFELEPIIELNEKISIRPYIDKLSIISNKKHWGPSLMGVNAIRILEESDYSVLRNALLESVNRKMNVSTLDDTLSDLYNLINDSNSLSMAEILERLKNAVKIPPECIVSTKVYYRNPDVVAYVLKRAGGICEKCGNRPPFNRKSDGTPYLEVHHIKQLSDGGEDTIDNALALCPNCHREIHFG